MNLKGKGVSLATVYRTLPLLVEAGLIQQVERNAGRDRYEHIYGHPQHIHWICGSCGSMQETDLSILTPKIQSQAESIRFRVGEVKLSIHGVCWKCRETDNDSQ